VIGEEKVTRAAPHSSLGRLELPLYGLVLAGLAGALLGLGAKNSALRERLPASPKETYALLANPQVKVQIVDARPNDDDHYLDSHIPGALPFPGCDDAATPAAARERIYPYLTTIVVTQDGDPSLFEQCRTRFGLARNLAGGMSAWSAAKLPEDSGDYSAPKSSAGGGCL
jgi:3-mercaptopyruvate sulfurtransferase SseA